RVGLNSAGRLVHITGAEHTLASLHEARTPVYALADVTVDADPACSIDEMTDRVLKALRVRDDVLAECRSATPP
ncbi:MAG: shikimate kinase, partial [Boseongicola sp.]|nr:shikimate kinase [Boseongicola sp.]